jgi:hypothetical protein
MDGVKSGYVSELNAVERSAVAARKLYLLGA